MVNASRGVLSRKIVYLAVMLVALAVDCAEWGISPPRAVTVVFTVIIAVSAGLLGWSPRWAGLVVVAASCTEVMLEAAVVAVSVGFALVVIDWLSRWWTLQTAGIVVLHLLMELLASSDLIASLSASLFVIAVEVVIGLVVHFYHEWLDDAVLRAETLRLQAETEEGRVRAGLALQLHDSVASELAQLLVTARVLLNETSGTSFEGYASIVEQAAESSLRHVRTLMSALDYSEPLGPGRVDGQGQDAAPCQTLSAGGRFLAARRISLEYDAGALDDMVRGLGRKEKDLVTLMLREGMVNCYKYARSQSVLRISAEVNGDSVSLEMASDRDDAPASEAAQAPLRGGTGLKTLAARAQALEGELTSGAVGSRWLLGLVLPRPTQPEGLS